MLKKCCRNWKNTQNMDILKIDVIFLSIFWVHFSRNSRKSPRIWHLELSRTPGTCFFWKFHVHFSFFRLVPSSARLFVAYAPQPPRPLILRGPIWRIKAPTSPAARRRFHSSDLRGRMTYKFRNDPYDLLAYGWALRNLKRHKEAIKIFEKVIQICINSDHSWKYHCIKYID